MKDIVDMLIKGLYMWKKCCCAIDLLKMLVAVPQTECKPRKIVMVLVVVHQQPLVKHCKTRYICICMVFLKI